MFFCAGRWVCGGLRRSFFTTAAPCFSGFTNRSLMLRARRRRLPTWAVPFAFSSTAASRADGRHFSLFRFCLLHPYFRSRRRAARFLPRAGRGGARGFGLLPAVRLSDLPDFGQNRPRSERFWLYDFLPTPHFYRAVGVVRAPFRTLRYFADSSQLGMGYWHYENLVDYFRVPFDIPAFRKGSRILREPVSISYLRAFRRILRLTLRGSWALGLFGPQQFGVYESTVDAGGVRLLPTLGFYERWRRYGLDNISHIGMGRR